MLVRRYVTCAVIAYWAAAAYLVQPACADDRNPSETCRDLRATVESADPASADILDLVVERGRHIDLWRDLKRVALTYRGRGGEVRNVWELAFSSGTVNEYYEHLAIPNHSLLWVLSLSQRRHVHLGTWLPYRWTGTSHLSLLADHMSVTVANSRTKQAEFTAVDLSVVGAMEKLSELNASEQAVFLLATNQHELAVALNYLTHVGRTEHQLGLAIFAFAPRLERLPAGVDTLVFNYCDLDNVDDAVFTKSLRHVDISKCHNIDIAGLENAARLERLDLFEAHEVKHYQVLSRLTQLKHLSVTFPVDQKGETIAHISALKGLRTLDLSYLSEEDDEQQYLPLGNLESLQILRMLTPMPIDFGFLRRLRSLYSLDIECHGSGWDNFFSIPPLEQLRMLTITNGHALKDLPVLLEMPSLMYLNVEQAVAIRQIADLRKAGRLKHLIVNE